MLSFSSNLVSVLSTAVFVELLVLVLLPLLPLQKQLAGWCTSLRKSWIEYLFQLSFLFCLVGHCYGFYGQYRINNDDLVITITLLLYHHTNSIMFVF